MRHNQQGFTLIEMIISLCLLAILLTYGLPNYYDFKQNQIMSQEVNRLVRTINFARSQSINSSEHIILCATHSGQGCDGDNLWQKGWMVFSDLNKDRQFSSNDEILLLETKTAHHITAKSSMYRQKIRFDQMGAAPGTNLTVRFCDDRGPEFGKSVIVSNVGRPRVAQSVDNCG
ncbi:MAG: GspH/FimT family pseudopilin [Marinicella sp.]|nr:GspH/FimT family pseudopilin [Xanthomonadales bacterium]